MKRRFLYTLAILCLAGCNLNEYCEDDQYEQDGKCYRCRTGDHLNADKTGCEANTDTDCGAKHSNCTTIKNVKTANCDTEGGVCKVSCKDGFNESNGRCIDPKAQTCMEDVDCKIPQNASSVKCDGYVCVINCVEGFHVEKASSCVANAYTSCSSDEECTGLDGVDVAKCNSELCSVKSCVTGYHLNDSNSACDMDTAIACGLAKTNCQELEHVSKVNCVDGKCQIASCKVGYHTDEAGEGCDLDSVAICGTEKMNCTDIANSKGQSCVDGICIFECNDGFVKNGQTCAFDYCLDNKTYIEEIGTCLKCDNGNITETLCRPNDYTNDCSQHECSQTQIYSNNSECIMGDVQLYSRSKNVETVFNNLRYIQGNLRINDGSTCFMFPGNANFPKLESCKDLVVIGYYGETPRLNFNSLKHVNGELFIKEPLNNY